MRQFLRYNRWATVLVAGFFMLATSGMALSRMTCLMGGHSSLSIGLAEDCCPEEGQSNEAQLAPLCCDVATVSAAASNFLPNTEVDLLPAWLALEAAPRLLLSEGQAPVLMPSDSGPPPLSGIGRLVLFSVQRV